MGSRTSLSLPSLVPAVEGDGPLECAAAACEDVLARHAPSMRGEIEHVMLAGGAGAGRDVAALLPRRLGLRAHVTCSLASGESGAAGLAVVRMADACCRGNATARVLVACVGGAQRDGAALPPASACLLSGAGLPAAAPGLRLERLATWSHRASSGEMTLSEFAGGFDLEASCYLRDGDELDLAAFLRDHLDVDAARAARAAWAIHAGAPGATSVLRSSGLEGVRASLALSDDRLAASREALDEQGTRATSGVWHALLRAIEGGAPEVVALGLGPGPTVEAARFTRVDAIAATDD